MVSNKHMGPLPSGATGPGHTPVGQETVIFTMSLASGDFSSELHIALLRTQDEVEKAVERWLDFMLTGLRLNADRMSATLGDDKNA